MKDIQQQNSNVLGVEVANEIKNMIAVSNINNNEFYKTFRSKEMDPQSLKDIFQQYYYYIRTFPKILAGLSYRVENETIRMKLSRTVVSELGDNGSGKPHYLMFEDVLKEVGVTLEDWKNVEYIPEAENLVNGLRKLFLEQPVNKAIGAHYVIEEFGFPMIVALYEGFRQYKKWTHEGYLYFYLHILVEAHHVDWILDAVIEAASDTKSAQQLKEGAAEVLALLNDFWNGLNNLAINADNVTTASVA